MKNPRNSRPSKGLVLSALLLGLVAGCGDTTAPAAGLVIISGNNQTGPVSTRLPDPIVVRVVTSSGTGLGQQPVSFKVVAGGGQLFTEEILTQPNGLATNFWELGPSPDSAQTVEVTFDDPDSGQFMVTFNATATATP